MSRAESFPVQSAKLRAVDILVMLTFIGYPLSAGVSGEIGLSESPFLSIGVRLLTAGLGLYCFLNQIRSGLESFKALAFCAFSAFWCAYFLRVLQYAIIERNILPWSGTEYLGYSVVFCILPALGAINSSSRSTTRVVWLVLCLGGLSLALNLHQSIEELSDLSNLAGSRAKSEKLNPISLGMLASNVLLVGVILYKEDKVKNLWQHAVATLLAFFALAALILSGSKGPAIALMASIFFLFAFPLSIDRAARAIIWSAAIIFILAAIFVYLGRSFDINLVNRFLDLASGQSTDQSNMERLMAFRSAWKIIQDSPFIGSALVEQELHYYPHNLILEILLSTGVVGLLLFGVFAGAAILGAYRILQNKSSSSWLALLMIQYMIGSMVSGGIHMSSQLWFLLTAMACSSLKGPTSTKADGTPETHSKRSIQESRLFGDNA